MAINRTKQKLIIQVLSSSVKNNLHANLSPEDSSMILRMLAEKTDPFANLIDTVTRTAQEAIKSIASDLKRR
jgi:hypothetical protein